MMFAGFLVAVMLWLSYRESSSDGFYKCPASCTCTNLPLTDKTSESTPGGRKVVCQRALSITGVLQILSDGLPVDTLDLDLSKNEITRLPRNSFENMKQLLRLDLSYNPLQELESEAFLGLDSLEHLDLSGTKLTSLNSNIFDGLPKLLNLSLADGRLSSLLEGSLDHLPSLKTINIRSDYLVCDCHLKWMTGWLEVTGVVLDASVVCSIPSKLRDRPLALLAADDMNCDFPLELPLFELNPSSMQVVFEGDRLPIECRTLLYTDEPMNVTWTLETSPNQTAPHNSTTTFTELTLGRVRSTWLLLNPLEGHHSGNWKCEVSTIRGNLSRNVRVVVLTAETPYCKSDMVVGNKGSFHWPRTVAGAAQSQPCIRGKLVGRRFGDIPVKSATRECDGNGQWKEMDVSRCGYISETTQFLEHFAKTEATIANSPRLVSHVEQLNDYVRKTDRIKDEIDILYISQIVEKLVRQVSPRSQLADLLVSITGSLMNVDAEVLRRAELKDGACNRLVAAVEAIPKNIVAGGEFPGTFTIDTENIFIRAASIDEDANNSGISCVIYEETYEGLTKTVTGGRRSAECRTGMNLTISTPVWKKPRLVVTVEPEAVRAFRCGGDLWDCGNQSQTVLVVTTFRNYRLFPEPNRSEFYVSSEIVSAGIVTEAFGEINTTASVILQMMSDDANIQLKTPAFWNTPANGGYGGWSTSGCEVLNRTDTAVRFTCKRFGRFALLQGHPIVKSEMQLWLLRFLETSPAIYVGSFALAASALSVVIAFISARNRLKMSRKTCHATCNMCAGLVLLSVTYVMWLPADHSPLLCSLGAVSLHFLSLSVLVWLTIILYKLRKKLTKAMEPPVQVEDTGEDEPKAPRSVVTIYLLGWGVAFILCGISAAISWNSYNKDYCFLAQESSLLMFFIPVGLLLLINTFLLIHSCYITQLHPTIDFPSTGRPGDRHPTARPDLISSHSSSPFLSTAQQPSEGDELSLSSAIDAEYTPNCQLKAISAILLLYLLTWTTGAFAAVLPFPVIPLQEILFPCLYATAAISLAAFLFVYCCVGREDVREKLVRCVKDRTKANYDAVSPNIAVEHDRPTPACSDNLSVDVATESSSCAWRSSQMNSSEGVGRRSKLDIDSLPSGNSTAPILPSVPFSNESPLQNTFNNTRQQSAAKKYWERKKCKMQRSSERGRRSSSGHQGSSAEECKLIDLTNSKPSTGYSSLNTTVFDRPFNQNRMPHRLSSRRSENRPCGSESLKQDARDFVEIGCLLPQQGVFRDEFVLGSEAPDIFKTGNYVSRPTCISSEHSDSAAGDKPLTSPIGEVSDDGQYDWDRAAFSRRLEPVKRTKDRSKHHHFRTSSVSDDHRGDMSHTENSSNLDPHCRMSSSKSSSQNSKTSRKRSMLLAENVPTRHPLHPRAEIHDIKQPFDSERFPIGSRSGMIQHGDRLRPTGRSNRLHRRRMMSSSEGSLADVWVLQKQHERRKFKKETSV